MKGSTVHSMIAEQDSAILSQKFRQSLPAAPAREAWVLETTLEYQRLLFLESQGLAVSPLEDSLLGGYLNIADHTRAEGCLEETKEIYRQVFGHRVPYNWTAKRDAVLKGTVDGGQPTTA